MFTQPDRTGRGHHRHVNPLKELALERGLPVFQPEKANTTEAVADLAALVPDLCVVAAYGQILSAELLAVPRLGAINVHASILPRYRGAAPIQTAILQGETETGVTIFQIEPKLDAGPILGIERTPIGPRETSGELEGRLASLGAELAVKVVDQLADGTAQPIVQDGTQASRAPGSKRKAAGSIGTAPLGRSTARCEPCSPGRWPTRPSSWGAIRRAGLAPVRVAPCD